MLRLVSLSSLILLASLSTAQSLPKKNSSSSSHKTHTKTVKSEPAQAPLTEEERAIHVLNRFTFGPRPGDIQTVEKMGTDAWFEQQLNPGQINDSVLERRLSDYPALALKPQQLLAIMPTEQMLRQVMQGKASYPSDPTVAAIYQVLIAKADAEKAKNEAAQKQTTPLTPEQEQALQQQEAAQKKANQARALVLAEQLLTIPKNQRMPTILQMPVQDRIILTENLQEPQKGQLVADFTPREREIFGEMGGNFRGATNVVANELMQAKILRAILSERQLQEVMTDFWFNHFNVFIHKDSDRFYTASYERDTIRPHALGKFRDLLLATAKDPAMLVYLDNWQSIGPDSIAAGRPRPGQKNFVPRGLNENYGREVMELHTVGVNGGYTQADVTNLSKILTGWTVDRPEFGGGFVFDPRRHEPGDKRWFGQTIRENGYAEGEQALAWLAAQPQTAHFISYKLAQRFVADNPPESLVDRMAKTFLSSDGDIKEVLRTMYHSPEFWSPKYYRTKVKTPLEFVASAFRATDTVPTNPGALVYTLQRMGEPLYQMLPPTGYPMTADHWMNTGALVDRLNFALALSGSKIGGIKFDAPHLLAAGLITRPAATGTRSTRPLRVAETTSSTPSGEDEALGLMESMLINGQVSAQTHTVIRQQLQDLSLPQAQDPAQVLNTMTALLLGAPEFQMK